MTVSQTLGMVGPQVDLEKAKAKVREVENEARFVAIRNIIQQVVASSNPATEAERESVRDRTIAHAMNIKADFGLAVSQKLLEALRNGQL
ncbi:MAG: hypothetical protein ACREQ7_24775 [Candidatus Binatia bacterium]